MLIQWPDRYYHSSHDTPDQCDPRSLALAVRCAATYAGFLAAAGTAERLWVAAITRRDAQVRLLRALDDEHPARAVARERVRAASALASLARLHLGDAEIGEARRAWESFAAREAPPSTDTPAPADGQRPRRLQRGMLDFQRHLVRDWDRLPAADREAWRRLERTRPELATAFDLAWFACDGRRTIAEIGHLVELETGGADPSALRSFFEWTEKLGITTWEAEETECSTSARATDGR
jgi:hypothetical protein